MVTAEQWTEAVEETRHGSDEAIGRWLVRSGTLTPYQCAQLRGGRTKLNLGPYLITDWIGQGGMGQVFKAVHNVMGRQCAVKVLPLEKATEEARESFLREIRLQAGLDCQYLVRAFDAGRDGNVHFLVTEYVPGTDLRRLVRSRGMLPVEEAAAIVMQAALGLAYAHEQGLIHRDVKPGNILVRPDGVAKVSDVGLAAWATALGDDPRAGKIVGTADFLSPEQIRSPREVGPASDIYSLGCTLYYTICGKVPYPGGDVASKCRRHCEDTPWHPRKFAPETSEEFVELIADMMDKDPARRIGSAAEVAERLEPWAASLSEPIARPLTPRAWTAPPPPAEDAGPPLPQGSSAALDGDSSHDTERSQSSDQGTIVDGPAHAMPMWDAAPTETFYPPNWSSAPGLSGRSVWTRVAVSLSVAIPLALLAGAVLGFFIRDFIE
nr:serine/threonine-protein kinase [Candidatus Laterigemmans baculatus]